MRYYISAFGLVVSTIVLIVGLVVWLESCQPRSSGVSIVGNNLANVPVGGQLVISSQDKYDTTYTITYDGENTIHVDCSGIDCSSTVDLCPTTGCKVSLSVGLFGLDVFDFFRVGDGTINVRWPDGYAIQT